MDCGNSHDCNCVFARGWNLAGRMEVLDEGGVEKVLVFCLWKMGVFLLELAERGVVSLLSDN